MNKDEKAILATYKKYHSGKENVITRDAFRVRYILTISRQGFISYFDDRQFRIIYSQLPIVTCDKGGFYPIRKEEILEYRDYLRKKAIPLFERFKRVCNAHPDLTGDEVQLELFGGCIL